MEVVISATLIGVVLVAALESVGSATRATTVAGDQVDAHLLAESLLSEIMAVPYEDPGDPALVDFGIESDEPASPTDRTAFDDVDDYDDWSQSPPVDRNGNALPGVTGWQRAVSVQKLSWANPTMAVNDNLPDQGIKRITVTTTDPDGVATSVVAIRGKYGSVEQQAGVTTDVVTDVTITLGADGETLTAEANLMNHAKD